MRNLLSNITKIRGLIIKKTHLDFFFKEDLMESCRPSKFQVRAPHTSELLTKTHQKVFLFRVLILKNVTQRPLGAFNQYSTERVVLQRVKAQKINYTLPTVEEPHTHAVQLLICCKYTIGFPPITAFDANLPKQLSVKKKNNHLFPFPALRLLFM